jgi:hypothetical protein
LGNTLVLLHDALLLPFALVAVLSVYRSAEVVDATRDAFGGAVSTAGRWRERRRACQTDARFRRRQALEQHRLEAGGGGGGGGVQEGADADADVGAFRGVQASPGASKGAGNAPRPATIAEAVEVLADDAAAAAAAAATLGAALLPLPPMPPIFPDRYVVVPPLRILLQYHHLA